MTLTEKQYRDMWYNSVMLIERIRVLREVADSEKELDLDRLNGVFCDIHYYVDLLSEVIPPFEPDE